MSGYHDGRQEAARPAPAASAASIVRGTIQRKPIASSSVRSGAVPSGSAMPQNSLSVSSAGQDVYSVSPASSIHRDRDSHTTEHPVSLGQQSSPERVLPATVSSYPQQWQQTETVTGHSYERDQQTEFQALSRPGAGPGQTELLPPLQRQSVIQRPEFTRTSWIFPRAGGLQNQSGDHNTMPQSGSQRRPSDLQLELAEARAREALSGRGPRIISYGPAPPAEDHIVAPTSFTVPVSHLPVVHSHETSTVPRQAVAPNVVGSNTVPGNVQIPPAQDVTGNIGNSGNGGQITNQKTKPETTKDRNRSPFMHYEDIDYFGPEAEETDLDSPDLDAEQEKLKFSEAQFGLGAAQRAVVIEKGKLHQPRTAVTEVSSAVTPTPDMAITSSPRTIEDNNGSIRNFPTSILETVPAGGLQMGIKARRSWERQQRRKSKKKQQHLDQPSSHMATLGTTSTMNMIMRIPSLISSAGRGGGSSVAGGGSNDTNSRSGEGRFRSNNPYYAHDHTTNEPHRNGGITSSHSNRDHSSNGHQDINIPPRKPADIDSNPPNQSFISPWTPEILWSLLSLATLIAIFLTLRAFGGKSIDPTDWPISPNVTLNTLIAFLTAICQLALLIPITQGLAQLKWNWFARAAPGGIPRQGRPLEDFVLFDDAAFGTGKWGGWPLGALKLLFSGKGRTLGVSACLVLLTGWLSGPFTQGTVGYQTRLAPAGSESVASVVRGERYFLMDSGMESIARREPLSGSMTQYQDFIASQKRAIQHGIHYYTHSTSANDNHLPAIPLLPPIPPQCSTPSCQFPLFSSLAVCVDTADVSSRLSISKISTTASKTPLTTAFSVLGFMPDSGTTSLRNAILPNGVYLLGSTGTCNLNISSPEWAMGGRRQAGTLDILTENSTLAFTNESDKLSAAIANFFFIYTSQTSRGNSNQDDEEAAFSAVEVLLHFCVNTYNVSVTQGVPTTEVVNSSTSVAQITTSEDGISILDLQDPLSSGSNSSSGPYLSVNLTATQTLQNQLASLIKGTYSSSYGDLMQGLTPACEVLGTAMFENDPRLSSSALAADNNTDSSGGGEQQRHQQTIGNLMLNVATSLTNTIRASSSSSSSQQSPAGFQRRQTSSRGEGGQRKIVTGTPLHQTTSIKVHYAPMTFLTIQVVLSVAFLVGIIIQTAVWGVSVLKGSSMDALLVIGARERAILEESEQGHQESQNTGIISAPENKKTGNKVRLRLASGSSLDVGVSDSNILGEPRSTTGGRLGGWYLDTGTTPTQRRDPTP